MTTNKESNGKSSENNEQKVILTKLAQEYSLTIEDLVNRGILKENIIVEK